MPKLKPKKAASKQRFQFGLYYPLDEDDRNTIRHPLLFDSSERSRKLMLEVIRYYNDSTANEDRVCRNVGIFLVEGGAK